MTAAVKRDRLIMYLTEVNEKKVSELYTLLEGDINRQDTGSTLTDRQLEILEERRASFLSGKDKGIDWQTMHDNIRRRRKTA